MENRPPKRGNTNTTFPRWIFMDANLVGTNFSGANLRGFSIAGNTRWDDSFITGADLTGARLGIPLMESGTSEMVERTVSMSGTDLTGATLKDTDLTDVDLTGATLQDANLTGAILKNTGLRNANLKDATVTQEQLNESKSLEGATMPDGTIHD